MYKNVTSDNSSNNRIEKNLMELNSESVDDAE
jgi:hypothetical protein